MGKNPAHTFHCPINTHCFDQAFSSPYRLMEVPRIRPLVNTVHYKVTYLLTCWLLIFMLI